MDSSLLLVLIERANGDPEYKKKERKKERKKENGDNSGRGQVVFTYSQVSPTPIHVHVGVS